MRDFVCTGCDVKCVQFDAGTDDATVGSDLQVA